MFLQLYYSCICLRDGFEMVPKYLQNEISGICKKEDAYTSSFLLDKTISLSFNDVFNFDFIYMYFFQISSAYKNHKVVTSCRVANCKSALHFFYS